MRDDGANHPDRVELSKPNTVLVSQGGSLFAGVDLADPLGSIDRGEATFLGLVKEIPLRKG